MDPIPNHTTAAQRARWLAELSEALDQARNVLWGLESAQPLNSEALDLLAQVEVARAQVRSLRLSRNNEAEPFSGPEWIGLSRNFGEDCRA